MYYFDLMFVSINCPIWFQICEKHFTPCEVQRITEIYREADIKLLSAHLKYQRLVESNIHIRNIAHSLIFFLFKELILTYNQDVQNISTTSTISHREAPAKKSKGLNQNYK